MQNTMVRGGGSKCTIYIPVYKYAHFGMKYSNLLNLKYSQKTLQNIRIFYLYIFLHIYSFCESSKLVKVSAFIIFLQTFLISGMMIATTVLAPILWQLWIYNNSANANYYFAINLLFSTAQIFLITDLLFAQAGLHFMLPSAYIFKMQKLGYQKNGVCRTTHNISSN